jgi:hypothetical protein
MEDNNSNSSRLVLQIRLRHPYLEVLHLMHFIQQTKITKKKRASCITDIPVLILVNSTMTNINPVNPHLLSNVSENNLEESHNRDPLVGAEIREMKMVKEFYY